MTSVLISSSEHGMVFKPTLFSNIRELTNDVFIQLELGSRFALAPQMSTQSLSDSLDNLEQPECD